MIKFIYVIFAVFLTSCTKNEHINPCNSYVIANSKTFVQVSEFLYDSAFLVPDTVLAGEPINLKFTNSYKATIQSVHWDIDKEVKLHQTLQLICGLSIRVLIKLN